MSRAMNVTATKDEVTAMCAKHGARVTAIETLYSGGTRVVLSNIDEATIIRKAYNSQLIKGPVKRSLWVRND